ncbi:MAG: alanine racemase, partial [Anaerolineae bacterium]|nr:alanine racemase [Anaerolineae bacterium]
PKIGIVTHVGYGGMAAFENVEQIVRETSLLVEHLPADGLAVLNYDHDDIRDMASKTQARVLTVAMTNFGADLMAYNIVAGLTKTGFDLRHGHERYVGKWTPLLGKHQLYCVLVALAVGHFYDIALDDGLKVLTEMAPLPGRMSLLSGINGCLLIDDTYDATPQSTLYALDWLQAHRGSDVRIILVIGDMDGLGQHTQHGHRLIGQHAAEACDVLVTHGADAALSARAAIDHGMSPEKVHITYSFQDAIRQVKERLRPMPDDVVLVKGGRTIQMENVVRALLSDEADQKRLVRQETAWRDGSQVQPTQTTWIEVDQAAIAHNVRLLKEMVGDDVTIMAVVKADGYGHGAVSTSITALANGAGALAVASLDEALELRNAGIEAPVLVLSYTPVAAARQAVRRKISLTVYDLDLAHLYNQVARSEGQPLTVHVKIDTGMGRMGVLANEAVPLFRHLLNMAYLNIEGIFTHFSMSDEDPEYTAQQLRTFKTVVNPLRANGVNFKYIHTANSAAILTTEDAYFNLVRPGIALYGLSPSETVPIPPAFKPAMTWKTVIAQVKALPPGSPVGYGQTYRTEGQERIAVIPIGYSHGFRRKPNRWQKVLIHGQFAPIVGRVSMEKTSINVTHIPNVSIGDEVVLLGKQGEAEITPDEVAEQLGTNNYEVITTVLARMPRR